MAVFVRSEVRPAPSMGVPAWLTGPISYPAHPAVSPLRPDEGGYSSSDYRSAGGGVYPDKYYYEAKCQPDDQLFSVVYQVDADTVATADASQPYPAVGILIGRSGGNTCKVQRYGALKGYSGLIPGNLYVLGDHGGLVTPPLPNDDVEFVQQIGTALNDTTLFVDPTGQITQRDIQPKPNKQAHFFFGKGAPTDSGDYAPQDVFVDRQSGQVYIRPTPAGRASQTYAGDGLPSDDNVYTPIALYFRQNGDAYQIDSDDPRHTGFSQGADAPSGAPVQTQEAYCDIETGTEYER